ncbi:ribonuclease HII [Sutterella sp.]|uniref:ribonuclease HII n=1 Tax=Sutterella sp. TaxID=1981025 RepID=UPI0026E0088C|nr:ribonuclease HII [Sutterella sp.]MDO5531188.1 ribonuclease HII [Sutterella sp.]
MPRRPSPKHTKSASSDPFAGSLFLADGLSGFPLLTAGVDEAGRGPLAGPVTAAAVILDPERPIEGLADSKKLSAKRREELAPLIRERALAWGIGWASVEEIDRVNILEATFLAMERALEALETSSGRAPEFIVIDGNRAPHHLKAPFETIVKGDALVPAISAASILAKTARDALMAELDGEYPGYGFAVHAGYGTKAHLEAIARLGPSPVHRRSFEPVKSMFASEGKTH